MIKFLIYFTITQIILFTLELTNFAQDNFIIPFTETLATVSARTMQLFDDRVVSDGIVIRNIDNGFAIAIQAGCNGVEALIVFAAAIIAFPSPWKFKSLGLIAGFFAVEILNLLRIISLFYLGQWDYRFFEWAHLYIWQALIMLDVLLLFLLWLHFLPRCVSIVARGSHAD